MARPFVFTGTTMLIAAMVFSYLDSSFTVTVLTVAVILFIPSAFLGRKREFFRIAATCLASLTVVSCGYTFMYNGEYSLALELCEKQPVSVTGRLSEYEFEYMKHYYTLKDITVDGNETELEMRVCSDHYTKTQIDDILTFDIINVYMLGATKDTALNYKADGIYIGAFGTYIKEHIPAENHTWEYHLNTIRRFVEKRLGETLQQDYAATTNALITGNKNNVDPQILRNFSYSGISHLFAVSGFHLTLWTSVLYEILKIFDKKNKLISSIISALFVVFFVALTGFSKSTIRSGLMILLTLTGKVTKYPADPLNSLFFALTVILAFNPFAATSISLLLSFFATLGIITLQQPLTEPLYKLQRIIRNPRVCNTISVVFSVFLVSVTASVFTIPVTALKFGYYTIASPLTNLLCTAAAQIMMPLGVILTIVAEISFLAKPLIFIISVFSKYIYFVTEKIAGIENAVIDAQNPLTVLLLFAILLAMIVIIALFTQENRVLRVCFTICLCGFITVSAVTQKVFEDSDRVTVANTSNGISVVYQSGSKSAIIGCGGFRTKSYALVNEAECINNRQISLLLIPGPENEKCLYMQEILSCFDFTAVVASKRPFDSNKEPFLPEDTIRSSKCDCMLDENTFISYIDTEGFSGARIFSDDFSCTVIFDDEYDISLAPEGWLSGDLLVTRDVPERAIQDNFSKIIISTSNSETITSDKIYCTKKDGTVSFTSMPSEGDYIVADNR